MRVSSVADGTAFRVCQTYAAVLPCCQTVSSVLYWSFFVSFLPLAIADKRDASQTVV